jgi:hypothetical protein
MSTSDTALVAGNDTSLTLRYELTSEEGFQIASEMAKASRSRWLSRLAGIAAGCMAIPPAMNGDWKIAAFFGLAGFTALTGHRSSDRLLRLLFRGVLHFDLILDQNGIRGVLEPRLRFKKWSASSQFHYAWSRLRKVERLPEYLILEFHGGGGAIIPVAAFASQDDLERCETWAEAGLAVQHMQAGDLASPSQIAISRPTAAE